MTAVKKYDRLDASGLWRAHADEQRREVIVSVGDSTLIIKDRNDRAIAHWSLATIETIDKSEGAITFAPHDDTDESLVISENEQEMIFAIELIQKTIKKTRPRSGRLRWIGVLLSLGLVAFLGFSWLPDALKQHSLKVVPAVTQQKIGMSLFERIEHYTGQACQTSEAKPALKALAMRTQSNSLIVLPSDNFESLNLPGDIILLSKTLVEDHDVPDVVAGYILVEKLHARQAGGFALMLEHLDLFAMISLLTTGDIPPQSLDDYAKKLLKIERPKISDEAVLATFAKNRIRSAPYAWAVDPTGESTIAFIEGETLEGTDTALVLNDADWLRLQNICEN